MVAHIYLIQEREFIRLGENVFKIGQSSNIIQRFKQYPPGSQLIYAFCTCDAHRAEKTAIDTLCKKFRFRLDLGREYLEGNARDIVACLKELALSELEKYDVADINTKSTSSASLKRKRDDSHGYLSCMVAAKSFNPGTTTSFQNALSNSTSCVKTSSLNLSTKTPLLTP